MTVAEWFEKHLDFVSSRYVSKTLSGKTLTFKRLAAHEDIDIDTPVDKITVGIADAVFKQCSSDISGSGSNKARKHLITAWNWGEKYIQGFLRKQNPFAAVDRSPRTRNRNKLRPYSDLMKHLKYVSSLDGIVEK